MDIYTKAIYRKYSDLLKSGKKSENQINKIQLRYLNKHYCNRLAEQ